MGLRREPGADWSDRMRRRLLRELGDSRLDYAVVLAQDAVYRQDGSRDDSATHFYVSNDYVFDLARECPKVVPGASVNPWRRDALAELERCRDLGARLVKVHTAIQGVDPALKRFDPFYRLAADLGMVLMFHTGYEHACPVVSQRFTDPRRLARALDHGLPVIAAHSGTCALFDPEDYWPHFVATAARYGNLWGDTAVLASWNRLNALPRLSRSPAWLRARVLHGSDYPLPPARLAFAGRVGLFPPERGNAFDMDLRIKESFGLGGDHAALTARLLPLLTQKCG
jgi:predicted TIM-barrel fold metal-dependent hydrolase